MKIKNDKTTKMLVRIIVSLLLTLALCSLSSCVSDNAERNSDTGATNFRLAGTKLWSGFYLDTYLYEDIINAEDTVSFKVQVLPVQETPSGFIYNGKSYAQYKEEHLESKNLVEKLKSLLTEGEALKYGESLYTTGTPEGELWSQERYSYKTQKYYGEQMLDSYIVNGEFLRGKLESDLAYAKEEMNKKNSLANEAYLAGAKKQLEDALAVFKTVDKDAAIENGVINLTVTKSSLAGLSNKYDNCYIIRYPLYVSND